MATKEAAGIGANEEESDDWEDIDCDDGAVENLEEVPEEEDEEKDSSATQSEESKSGFVVLQGNSSLGASDAAKPAEASASSSFSVIKSGTQGDKTESFEVIGDSASSIADARGPKSSSSSYASALQGVMHG